MGWLLCQLEPIRKQSILILTSFPPSCIQMNKTPFPPQSAWSTIITTAVWEILSKPPVIHNLGLWSMNILHKWPCIHENSSGFSFSFLQMSIKTLGNLILKTKIHGSNIQLFYNCLHKLASQWRLWKLLFPT